ncbi:hypothetical protein [Plantactinospora endophytica]|uniref:Uncharacterized protein n=1 Tax=Plantactinospora endophytica TaxID=673535 RepID=A0ABQ4DUC8_9ACTN|nr:hypothetical protein [Plantactinospora endophytica]GIG86052.1 hypothetical protein Pen02_09880 [Plantactinospora endophytica]
MAIPPPPTDAELDTYIRTRYALIGIDLSTLPENDPGAPMDQARVLANARSTIRQEVSYADYVPDQQAHAAVLYPAPMSIWTGAYQP